MHRAGLALVPLLAAGCGSGGGHHGVRNGAIAVAGYRSGISRVDVDGSHLRRLTTGPQDVQPDWSPDGRSIAFARCRPNGARCRIFTVHADGSDVRAVAGGNGYGPTWSPDGKKLAFTAPGGLALVNAGGGGLQVLTSLVGKKADWSPEGRRLAVATVVDLYVIDVKSGRKRSLHVGLSLNSLKSGVAWSPDGRRIAFVNLNLNGLAVSLLLIRPDGSGRRHVRLPRSLRPQVDFDLDWSPDGRSLVFTGVGDPGPGIYVVPVSGGRPRAVLLGQYSDPAWQRLP